MGKEIDKLLIQKALQGVEHGGPQVEVIQFKNEAGETVRQVSVSVATFEQMARIAQALEKIGELLEHVNVFLGPGAQADQDDYAPVDENGSGYPQDVETEPEDLARAADNGAPLTIIESEEDAALD